MKRSVVILAISVSGCTNTQRANLMSIGTPGKITCYSGGKIIYEGRSTGKIESVSKSDGWQFQDAMTEHFIRVSGDCVIDN